MTTIWGQIRKTWCLAQLVVSLTICYRCWHRTREFAPIRSYAQSYKLKYVIIILNLICSNKKTRIMISCCIKYNLGAYFQHLRFIAARVSTVCYLIVYTPSDKQRYSSWVSHTILGPLITFILYSHTYNGAGICLTCNIALLLELL